MKLPITPELLKKKLIEQGLLTDVEFDEIALDASRKNQDLIDALNAHKAIQQEYVYTLIAAELGVPRASLDEKSFKPELVKLLPEPVARQYQAIVFDQDEAGVYQVAMVDPGDLDSVKFISQYLRGPIMPYFATENQLQKGFIVYGVQSAVEFRKTIEQHVQASLKAGNKNEHEAATDLPIVAIVDTILSYGISMGASDIHIEVLEEATLVRYRIDGIMREVMRVPKVMHPGLTARLKLLAGLKLDEHSKPQDGRFRHENVNEIVDVRVSVMPTYYGEKVEMRLLQSGGKVFAMEELGLSPETVKIVAKNLHRSYGMLLVTGPTGSGKSTTLYGVLNILNTPEVNIVTIEDPIEYNIPFVNQSQINPQAGITFASGLRAFLRQDPNVIMVGEIRDEETANVAVQAALTGHILLSTLHTNDAPTAIPRLFDLKVPPFLVSSVLSVIIAQRLVRKSCSKCISSYTTDKDTVDIIIEELTKNKVPSPETRVPKILYTSKGCDACGGTGYRGRIGIYEVLEVDDTIKKLIVSHDFSLDDVRDAARKNGMKSMFEDGLTKAQLGLTSMEEVLRVIRE